MSSSGWCFRLFSRDFNACTVQYAADFDLSPKIKWSFFITFMGKGSYFETKTKSVPFENGKQFVCEKKVAWYLATSNLNYMRRFLWECEVTDSMILWTEGAVLYCRANKYDSGELDPKQLFNWIRNESGIYLFSNAKRTEWEPYLDFPKRSRKSRTTNYLLPVKKRERKVFTTFSSLRSMPSAGGGIQNTLSPVSPKYTEKRGDTIFISGQKGG